MSMQISSIQADANHRADSRTAELLPMLMDKLAARDGLSHCRRHDTLIHPYVDAQINLTRAKRAYWHDHWQWSRSANSEEQAHAQMLQAEERRNEKRQEYRGTPCTCWVSKR